MKKNIIIIIISILLGISVLGNLFAYIDIIRVQDGSIRNYEHMLSGHIPKEGCVPNVKAAVKIADAVFDNIGIKYGVYTVEYDKDEEIWIVQKGWFLMSGGYVLIKKSNGEIIETWMNK